ncbi:MAG: tRNA pseudouridine(38-40) synthase TruA [Gammaproteobacteria bacterium]|nr:tRNA pseudouridine(38-40) synthase TruA [Gammaproteobacteria bacterium]
MRCALVIEYDGSGFNGWQHQPAAANVQDCVEQALSRVADHDVKTVCAGRTDSGVHALAQVVHFDTVVERPAHSWRLGANTHLPPSISVVWAGAVADDFNARFSARERTYRYLILNRSSRAAVEQTRAWSYPQCLDVRRMREAAPLFLGKHDFSAFRAAGCQARTTQRTVSQLEVDAHGDHVVIQVAANAFLQNMVRIITGVLVTIGTGDRETHWVDELLNHGDRTQGGVTVPACGLSLVRVRYPEEYGIPMPVSSFM